MAGRYSPPPHPHPEREGGFNPLAHLLKHLADSPPTTPVVFSKAALIDDPSTHDPEDILREIRSDGDHPFPIDRNTLKKVVEKRMGTFVENISFLSSGTFHKAFLVRLEDGREIVARIARRFMPRAKTESEVATINYVRQHTDIPVPYIYHFDSNPYNRLGGEYILMSKAPGIPLHRQYHHFSTETLHKFFRDLARIMITLFCHRFPMIGSLYQHPLHRSPLAVSDSSKTNYKFRVGPIISWPFFGGGRGERPDIPRGPWASERAYLGACADREVMEVKREGEGQVPGHRPHLPPEDFEMSSDEDNTTAASLPRISSAISIKGGVGPSHTQSVPMTGTSAVSSLKATSRRPPNRRHHSHRGAGLRSVVNSVAPSAYPSDDEASSSSDEDMYGYRDYRSHIRSSLLVAQQTRRLDECRNDMDNFVKYMTETLGIDERDPEFREFAIDMHDLSTANVFVDPDDLGKITCIIDWESTCIRPLWQCAHLPSFLANDPTSPEADLFRQIVAELSNECSPLLSPNSLPNGSSHPLAPSASSTTLPSLAANEVHPPAKITSHILHSEAERWLKGERERSEWRRAHKVIEWDGWEEGLVNMVLGDIPKVSAEIGMISNAVGSFGFGDRMLNQYWESG